MTFQHPEILEFLNSLRSTSEYKGYVRIWWYNPWDVATGYRVVWYFTSSKCIIVIKIGISDFLKICDLKIIYCPQKLHNIFSNIFVVKKRWKDKKEDKKKLEGKSQTHVAQNAD